MQQWLNFVPIADAVLGLITAIVNLATTAANRRNNSRDRADKDTTS
jgi:hypothetical protein